MKVVNPYGRTVSIGEEAHFAVQPRACTSGRSLAA